MKKTANSYINIKNEISRKHFSKSCQKKIYLYFLSNNTVIIVCILPIRPCIIIDIRNQYNAMKWSILKHIEKFAT